MPHLCQDFSTRATSYSCSTILPALLTDCFHRAGHDFLRSLSRLIIVVFPYFHNRDFLRFLRIVNLIFRLQTNVRYQFSFLSPHRNGYKNRCLLYSIRKVLISRTAQKINSLFQPGKRCRPRFPCNLFACSVTELI